MQAGSRKSPSKPARAAFSGPLDRHLALDATADLADADAAPGATSLEALGRPKQPPARPAGTGERPQKARICDGAACSMVCLRCSRKA